MVSIQAQRLVADDLEFFNVAAKCLSFFYISIKTCCRYSKERLIETVLLSTNSTCLNRWLRK